MKVGLTLRIAVRALRRNKVRSLLTALGIVVGIAAVIAVVAVGHGATEMVRRQISSMGNNLVIVFPGSRSTGGFHGGMGTQQTLTAEDADAIAAESSYVFAVSPVVRSWGQAVYKENNWPTSIQGVSERYPDVRNWDVERGAFFSDADVRAGARVCLLGRTAAENLFQDEDPLGKVLRVREMPFRVVGVLPRKGSAAWGRDQDDTIIMPWSTVRRVLEKSPFNTVSQILVSLHSLDALQPALEDIRRLLRQRHRIGPDREDDFTVTDMGEVTQAITQVSRLMTMLLTVIASISLFVGGIGIMNIMLVSVTERTREIGLRMAMGARRKDILLQFLVESVALSGVGGLLGTVLGALAARVISRVNGWPVDISLDAVAIALIFSAGVGVFFGFYPALRASRLNPIEALRYE